MSVSVKKTKKKGCNRKARYVITLPFGVTKEFISKCKKNGFIDSPKHTKAGLLYLRKGHLSLSGSLCIKYITVVCSINREKECENEINSLVKLLNDIV
ncbi:MAG TPA: hypothetical protein VMX17_05515 [Candidatus Glassbacteria bacterium]|nr:hypothetical protein [Candidatus Glassbacteria bacterium]